MGDSNHFEPFSVFSRYGGLGGGGILGGLCSFLADSRSLEGDSLCERVFEPPGRAAGITGVGIGWIGGRGVVGHGISQIFLRRKCTGGTGRPQLRLLVSSPCEL